MIAMSDFPWEGADQQVLGDLSSRIEGGVYVTRQIAKVYDYLMEENRIPLEKFIPIVFPKLEEVVEQILSNFNEATSVLL